MTSARVLLLFPLVAVSAAVTGCHRPAHEQAKAEARERWTAVRGRVKFQLARQQFERHLFDDAIETLREAIALDPQNVAGYALLAQASLETGKPASAEQALDVAWQAGLDSAELHYLKGVILEQRGRLDLALLDYEKARAMNDAEVDYLIAQVECLVALDQPAEALRLVDENLNRFDDQASVVILGARIAALRGDTVDAIRRYRHPSISLQANRLAAQELGLLLARNDRCDEAIGVLRPFVDGVDGASASEDGSLRRALAACYLANGAPALAKAILIDHAWQSPDDVAAQVLLARGALALGDTSTALDALDRARLHAPDDPDVALLVATVQWRIGDWASAESVLSEILRTNPDDADAWCLQGEVLIASGRAAEARSSFERALGVEPDNQWALTAMRHVASK